MSASNHQHTSYNAAALNAGGSSKIHSHKSARINRSATTQLSELLAGYATVTKQHDCQIATLQLNSCRVRSGDMFIALPGMTSDGRAYIGQALANGASVVLFEKRGAEDAFADARGDALQQDALIISIENLQEKLGIIAARYFGNPSTHLPVIGVTGTNGKTTTAYLLAQALELLGMHCGYCGTIGSGFVDHLQHSQFTTTDAISIQAQLCAFRTEQADAVSMEVSSHGLQQGRVNAVDFDIAIFTNLTQDHLDYHQSMAHYGNAKQKLFECASLRTVLINSDDDFGRKLLQWCKQQDRLTCISYGIEGAEAVADLRAVDVTSDAQGIRFTLAMQGGRQQITSKLLGDVNVSNLLATIGCLLAMGYEIDAIAEVIVGIDAPPGRMEMFGHGRHQPTVVIDYAHTPDALARALNAIRPLCRGKLVVVFGCGGDRDQGKRPQMGRIAQALADRVIITDDNPRAESAAQIVEQIQQGMSQTATVIHDRKQAISTAMQSANADDLILLAGKGHEQTQIIGSVVQPLSDRIMVAELLEALA